MKKVKKGLAVLMAMALLCGFMALGVSAADAEPAQLTETQMAELMGYMRVSVPFAVLEAVLQRVPRWLSWAVFAKGSSFEAMEAELKAELKKAGLDVDKYFEWLASGDIMEHAAETLIGNKVIAEKGPGIVKKHCAIYIGWLFDRFIWVNGLTGRLPLFA